MPPYVCFLWEKPLRKEASFLPKIVLRLRRVLASLSFVVLPSAQTASLSPITRFTVEPEEPLRTSPVSLLGQKERERRRGRVPYHTLGVPMVVILSRGIQADSPLLGGPRATSLMLGVRAGTAGLPVEL